MSMKKIGMTLAVSAAVGVSAMPAHAIIVGVPGEAMLLPLYAQANQSGQDDIWTAAIITTPAQVGFETVFIDYTMPNLLKDKDGNPTEYFAPAKMVVKWTAFDEKSEHKDNGTFGMTPDDVYFWSPSRATMQQFIGYVVFSDGGDGTTQNYGTQRPNVASTFAMTGTAFMLLEESCDQLGDEEEGLCTSTSGQALSLPMIPMADGVDHCQDRSQSSWPAQQSNDFSCITNKKPHLAVTYQNNVVAASTSTGSARVGHVSPLVGGIRMQGVFTGDANGVSDYYHEVLATGLVSPYDGNWTHVFWYSDNYAGRSVATDAVDDDETYASCIDIPMPNELHAYVYADEDNRIYDLVQGFKNEINSQSDQWFGDACLTAQGVPAQSLDDCTVMCGLGDPGFFGWPQTGFTNHTPGIGLVKYWMPAGPYDTSTAVLFQFLTNIDWDNNYSAIQVGSNFEIYSGGYQAMNELGGFRNGF